MMNASETDPGAMIYIPSFIKIGSGIQVDKGDSQTHREHGNNTTLLIFFFPNNESRLKISVKTVYILSHT
jgi:hypothetical protein